MTKYDELVDEDKTFRPKTWQSEIEQIEKSIDEYKYHASGRAFILATGVLNYLWYLHRYFDIV